MMLRTERMTAVDQSRAGPVERDIELVIVHLF